MKFVWQSKTMWFNMAGTILFVATFLTTEISPALLVQAGIPSNYVTRFYVILGLIITIGNKVLRLNTNTALTFTNGNSTNGTGK